MICLEQSSNRAEVVTQRKSVRSSMFLPYSLIIFLLFQASGVTIQDACQTEYEDMKLKKKYAYMIFKLTDDLKQIEIETKGDKGKTGLLCETF